MTTPTAAAAQPFTQPREDAATQLARDIALIIESMGQEQGSSSPSQKSGRYTMGQKETLVLLSHLEMDKDAPEPDRTSRRWNSVRVVAYMQSAPLSQAATRVPLFNAICTDREAIAGAHPIAGLENLPFVASDIAPGQWVHAVRSMASALRSARDVTFETHRPGAPLPRRAPHWHAP